MTVPLAALALGACTASSTGPSLAPRAVETRGLEEPVAPTVAAQPADAALRGKIDAALADVRNGQTAFAALLPRAQAAADGAGAAGSESWLSAQQLVSALEGARGPSPAGLATIDELLTARLAAGDTAGTAELEAARAEALPIVEAQDQALDRLQRKISR
jgi:hypothetical protein